MTQIREAMAARDAAAIATLHQQLIDETTVTFRSEPTSPEDRAAWITGRQADGNPVLVAEDDSGGFLGYASYGPFRGLDGYRLTVEHTIALPLWARGRGVGTDLMAALIARARAQGLHIMIGALSADNEGSQALHRRCGFHRAGTLPQTGQKFGRWLDLELWALRLDDRAMP